MSERKDFEQYKVDIVYRVQDGCCLTCGNSLKQGFHRHHKDKNNANNKVDNLQLICAECHRATLGNAVTKHREQEKKILKGINDILDEGFGGKFSGTVMKEMQELMMKSLKLSRNINELDVGIEYPSASLTFGTRIKEIQTMTEYYLKGLHEGIALGIKETKKE